MSLRFAGRWATVLLVLVAGSMATAGSARAADAPLRYVALGDSYSAASGVLPPDPAAAPECLRSTRNYPHVVAERLGAKLTDVTCGAAETRHFTTSQYPGVAPQLDALSADTQLVTLTIGGNDSNVFIGAILGCGAAGATGLEQGSPCKDQYGSSFEDTVRSTTYPAIVEGLRAIHQKAPQARVLILAYPRILPADRGCFPQMPIAEGDVPYLNSLQTTLNDAVKRAAAATGSTYVDTETPSVGHDACQAIGTRWIEPVVAGTNPVIVHPNALGESEMAARVLLALQGDPASTPGAAATPVAKLTRRVLPGRRLRLGCRVTGATLKTCRVTVLARRGKGLKTVRTVTIGAGRTRVVRVGAARRFVLRGRLTTTDGRRLTARRTLTRKG